MVRVWPSRTFANASNSNTPIGPFQITVLQSASLLCTRRPTDHGPFHANGNIARNETEHPRRNINIITAVRGTVATVFLLFVFLLPLLPTLRALFASRACASMDLFCSTLPSVVVFSPGLLSPQLRMQRCTAVLSVILVAINKIKTETARTVTSPRTPQTGIHTVREPARIFSFNSPYQ